MISRLILLAALGLTWALPCQAMGDDEPESGLWSGRDATGDEEAASDLALGSPTVRQAKAWGAGFRYGNGLFDPAAIGLEALSNRQAPTWQYAVDLQQSRQNLLKTETEEPLTSVSSLKLQRTQVTLLARYFFRPELYGSAGLGVKKTAVSWSENERLGTGSAKGQITTTAATLDLRFGQQWAFKNGVYLTFEAAEFTATFAPKAKEMRSAAGSASREVDEASESLRARSRLEGRRPAWEFFNLCIGKMF